MSWIICRRDDCVMGNFDYIAVECQMVKQKIYLLLSEKLKFYFIKNCLLCSLGLMVEFGVYF